VADVKFRQFWGGQKRENLLASLDRDATDFEALYEVLVTTTANQLLLRPNSATASYPFWSPLSDLCRILPVLGLNENRGGGLVAFDRADIEGRMKDYFDLRKSFDEIGIFAPQLTSDRANFSARRSRERILSREGFSASKLRRFMFRPFDMRWAYVSDAPGLWNRSRPDLLHILPDAGGFLITRLQAIAEPEGHPTCYTRTLCDQHALHKDEFQIPYMENLSGAARPNISEPVIAYLTRMGFQMSAATSGLVWDHALATTYSPSYLTENAAGIRQGWPRIPLPHSADLLRASATLGEQVATLLDPDTPVPGVTTGTIRPELATVAVPATAPDAQRDWRLTGWGSRSDKGITMPGRGRTDPRDYSADETATAARAALLGKTRDVWMNGASFWRNVPEAVWDLHIGGYQVIKKWLSYRDHSILDRALNEAEVEHIQTTARRLAALLLLGPKLDASHRACAAAHVPLPAA
jgi:hypothetical protein